jgi:hypothetical protein
MAGKHICILIDPALEDPLTHERPDNAQFFYLRRYLEWESDADTEFVAELCKLVLAIPMAQMIVQDYSGANLRRYYPLQRFPQILHKVLFDVTYADGSCYVDFSAVNIIRRPDGGFVNPVFEPLDTIRPYISQELLVRVAKERNIAIQFVHSLYSIQNGTEEPRHWCTQETIRWRADWLFVAYGLRLDQLKDLLTVYLIDLAAAANATMTPEYVSEIIGSKDYIAMTGTLTSII